MVLELQHVEELVIAGRTTEQDDSVIGVEMNVKIAFSNELLVAHLAAEHRGPVLGVEVVLADSGIDGRLEQTTRRRSFWRAFDPGL